MTLLLKGVNPGNFADSGEVAETQCTQGLGGQFTATTRISVAEGGEVTAQESNK